MRVLYVNQVAQMSGAEHSLLTLIAGLGNRVEPILACPPGELSNAAKACGIRVRHIEGTNASLDFHPIRTPLSIAQIAVDGGRVAHIARHEQVDVVHANTTRAGLIATVFAGIKTPPILVHVRDWSPEGRVVRAILQYVRLRATALVCISELVADEFPNASGRTNLHVIHNPVDGSHFDPDRIRRAEARARLGLDDDALIAAVVGQLTEWKGQADAMHAFALIADQFPQARLLIVGSAKFQGARLDNNAYHDRLRAVPARLGIDDRVSFLGERRDIPEILRALDVLLVPSWKEAFGRVIVEGMAMRLPVIATNAGGPREIVTHDVDGLLIAPNDPEAWGRTITELFETPALRERLGSAGHRTARERFSPSRVADSVFSVYRELLSP